MDRGKFDLLLRLRDTGLRLATLTNSTAQADEAQLAYAGMREHFEQVISADEIQRFKPAPEVYQFAARRLGVEPGQVMNPFGPQPDVRGEDLGVVVEQILAVELEQS